MLLKTSVLLAFAGFAATNASAQGQSGSDYMMGTVQLGTSTPIMVYYEGESLGETANGFTSALTDYYASLSTNLREDAFWKQSGIKTSTRGPVKRKPYTSNAKPGYNLPDNVTIVISGNVAGGTKSPNPPQMGPTFLDSAMGFAPMVKPKVVTVTGKIIICGLRRNPSNIFDLHQTYTMERIETSTVRPVHTTSRNLPGRTNSPNPPQTASTYPDSTGFAPMVKPNVVTIVREYKTCGGVIDVSVPELIHTMEEVEIMAESPVYTASRGIGSGTNASESIKAGPNSLDTISSTFIRILALRSNNIRMCGGPGSYKPVSYPSLPVKPIHTMEEVEISATMPVYTMMRCAAALSESLPDFEETVLPTILPTSQIVTLYPNPATSGYTNVVINNEEHGLAQVHLLSTSGAQISTQSANSGLHTITLNELPVATYLVRIQYADGFTQTTPLVVSR